MPEVDFENIIENETKLEEIASRGGNYSNSLSELRNSLDNLREESKNEYKPNQPDVKNGKIIYLDSQNKPVRFGEFENLTDYIDKQVNELEEKTNPNDRQSVIDETSKEYAKGVLGIDSTTVAEAVKPSIEIRLTSEIQTRVLEGNERAEANAEKVFNKETIAELSDPSKNSVGSDGSIPQPAQDASNQLINDLAKERGESVEDLNKKISELQKNIKEGNENFKKMEKIVEDMQNKSSSPVERDSIQKAWDILKMIALAGGVGFGGYFVWSVIRQHQLDLSGCFLTVYDATTGSITSQGKVKQLTCGDYKKNAYGSDMVFTKENCIKNTDGTYPIPSGCKGCEVEIDGDTCMTCPKKDGDSGDILCSQYCSETYLQSKNPSSIYKFNCAKWSFTGAVGDMGNQVGKLVGNLLDSLFTFIDKLLKWGPYILLGILGLYIVYLFISKFFGSDEKDIVIKEESPPSHSFGYRYRYRNNNRNNMNNGKYVIKF